MRLQDRVSLVMTEESKSWVSNCLEACPAMLIPSVTGKTIKCGKMKKKKSLILIISKA